MTWFRIGLLFRLTLFTASANAENGRSLERFGSPTHSANWEDDYEQEDFVIDKEVPWTDRLTQQQAKSSKPIQEQNEPSKFVQQQTEPSKPIQQHTEPSKPIQQNEFTFDSLYDNPWAS
ncbi:hypothetical protein J132_00772 [Termitomyces sp. J132]|nr:hypothetical protein J132_00772 [Termitomyces sp. J132]